MNNTFIRYVLTIIILSISNFAYAQDDEQDNNVFYVDEAGVLLAESPNDIDEFVNAETYFLGPYDVISIYGKGNVEFGYRTLVISPSGDIIVPIAGNISVKGLTFAEAKQEIQAAFKKKLKNITIELSLDRLRPVSFYLGGDVPKPGRYKVNAGTRYDFIIGTLIDQKIMSRVKTESQKQRPSYTGLDFDRISDLKDATLNETNTSYRELARIYDFRMLKVTNRDEVRYIDLEAFFNSGNKKYAPFISDGDQITLLKSSSTRPKISISGAVNNPFSGTYRADDNFTTMLDIASGLHPEADSSRVLIFSNEDGAIVKKEYSFSKATSLEKLNIGDQIVIPFKEVATNTGLVSIEGEVKIPGTFSISDGKSSTKDVLELSEGFTAQALPTAAYIIRNSYDNKGVKSVSSFNMSLLTKSSDQFLEGFDYMNLEQALNPNRMAIDLSNSEALSRTKLMDGDHIYIPKDEQTVSIIGQVNEPGFYSFDNNQTVSEYLDMAGGLTVAADLGRIFVIKAGSRAWLKPEENSLQSGDIIFVDRIPFDNLTSNREFIFQNQQLEIARAQNKNARIQLLLSGVSTVVGIITTYIVITR